MGDNARHREFAREIVRRYPRATRLADVAGGKGELQACLRRLGRHAVTFDRRQGRKSRPTMRYVYGFFGPEIAEQFDAVVGMHPDAATDVIIAEAARRRVPFAVVPCCVMPVMSDYGGRRADGDQWFAHLREYARGLGFRVSESRLPITGRNRALWGEL